MSPQHRRQRSAWQVARRLGACAAMSHVSKAANRGWAEASRASLLEQHHLMSSVVSLFALNPLVWPAVLLAWLLQMSMWLSRYAVVRTALYLLAVAWSQIVIWSIRAVAPCCFIFVGYCILQLTVFPFLPQMPALFTWPLILFSLTEIIFVFHTMQRANRLQARVLGPELSTARRWLMYRRVEETSIHVLPMAMPRSCMHWKKFRHLRINTAMANASACTLDVSPASGSHTTRKQRSRPREDGVVTPSSRYLDSALQPLQLPSPGTIPPSPASQLDQKHPLEFLKGWFYNIPMQHVKHDNLMVFFAENSMGKHLNELTPGQREELEEVVSYVSLKLSRLSAAQIRRRHQAKLVASQARLNAALAKQAAEADAATSELNAMEIHSRPSLPPMLTAAAFKAGRVPLRLPLPAVSPSPSASDPTPLDEQLRSPTPSPSTSPSPTQMARTISNTSPDDSDSEQEEAAERIIEEAASHCITREQMCAEAQREQDEIDRSTSDASEPATPSTTEELDDALLGWDGHVAHGTLRPGYNPAHDPMRLNVAEVTYLHRPLCIYLGIIGLGYVAAGVMRWMGFSRHTTPSGKLSYWYRRAVLTGVEIDSSKPRADPVVLIHGIGIGVFTYLHFLRSIWLTSNSGTCGQRSVYVLELPSISMRLDADSVPAPQEHVAAFSDMLYKHEMEEREALEIVRARRSGITLSPSSTTANRPALSHVQQSGDPIKALIVAHSYGTFVATWVMKYASELLAGVVLVDPVCFMVYDPTLIYNFIYRTPFSLVTRIYNYFTSKELGISYTLCRHFFWYENCCWRQDLERLGMTPSELESSLIEEREQCVASLPYNQKDLIIEEEEDEGGEEELNICCVDASGFSGEYSSKQMQRNKMMQESTYSCDQSYSESSSPIASFDSTIEEHEAELSARGSLSAPPATPVPAETPLCPARSPGLRAHIFLAANDDIAPVASTVRFLQAALEMQKRKWGDSMLAFTIFPDIGHAECLFHPKMKEKIINTVQTQSSDKQIREGMVKNSINDTLDM